MSTTGKGEPRYFSKPPKPLGRMKLNGADLGPMMRPQDIYIWVRHINELTDDEIPVIFAHAASAVADDPSIFDELSDADVATAIADASLVSKSRALAWRKRHREMNWLELRMFFLGLKLTL